MPMVKVSLGAAIEAEPCIAKSKTNTLNKLFIFRSDESI